VVKIGSFYGATFSRNLDALNSKATVISLEFIKVMEVCHSIYKSLCWQCKTLQYYCIVL